MDFYTFQYHNSLIPLLCPGWLLDLFPITAKAFHYTDIFCQTIVITSPNTFFIYLFDRFTENYMKSDA